MVEWPSDHSGELVVPLMRAMRMHASSSSSCRRAVYGRLATSQHDALEAPQHQGVRRVVRRTAEDHDAHDPQELTADHIGEQLVAHGGSVRASTQASEAHAGSRRAAA